MASMEKCECLVRFVITSSESIERAIADCYFGDWIRQAGGYTVSAGEQGMLTDRANLFFSRVLTTGDEAN